MSQMNQVNVICLPHSGYLGKTTITTPLPYADLEINRMLMFFNCLQLPKIRESNSNYTFISYHKLTKQSLKLKTALHFI